MKSKEIHDFRKTYVKYEKECVFEGYKLAVLFDEKDSVKEMGGRWDADKQTWWMPENKLLHQLHDNGTLVRDELNDKNMIMGPYGEFNRILIKGKDGQWSGEEFMLQFGMLKFVVTWYTNQDAVEFVGPYNSNNVEEKWFTVEDAKTRWDELIKEGFNRVENSCIEKEL